MGGPGAMSRHPNPQGYGGQPYNQMYNQQQPSYINQQPNQGYMQGGGMQSSYSGGPSGQSGMMGGQPGQQYQSALARQNNNMSRIPPQGMGNSSYGQMTSSNTRMSTTNQRGMINNQQSMMNEQQYSQQQMMNMRHQGGPQY